MNKVNFFYEDTDFTLPKATLIRGWVKTIIKEERFQLEQINYIFCSDVYLLSLNEEYLNHDTFTDIITFDYTEERQLEGDIYISVDRIKENAQTLCVNFEQELKRVMAHGVLHMMGYRDKSPEEQFVMRAKEETCLSLQF